MSQTEQPLRRMTEAEFGQVWLNQAIREGHAPKAPQSPQDANNFKGKMATTRRDLISDMVHACKDVRLSDLKARFPVSENVLVHDLNVLKKAGRIHSIAKVWRPGPGFVSVRNKETAA